VCSHPCRLLFCSALPSLLHHPLLEFHNIPRHILIREHNTAPIIRSNHVLYAGQSLYIFSRSSSQILGISTTTSHLPSIPPIEPVRLINTHTVANQSWPKESHQHLPNSHTQYTPSILCVHVYRTVQSGQSNTTSTPSPSPPPPQR
jgi:hypothetical protein